MMNLMKHMATGILNKAEEPDHEFIKLYSEFEVRRYPETMWITTKVKALTRAEAVMKGFWKMYYYVEGDNEKGEKLTMTSPILVRIEPGEGPDSASTFTVCLYVSRMYREDPVKPLKTDLQIRMLPAMTVLVRPFGGFADDDQWITESKALLEFAREEYPHQILDTHYYTAAYDSPFKLIHRRNEVWLQTVE